MLMKKLNFLLASLALLLGFNLAHAEIVSPYLVDFNTPISTTSHDFKVASGWSHIVESGYVDYETVYVDYSYSATGGVDGTGALQIGSQTLTGGWYSDESQEVHDYLVTPAVTGHVTIKAKRASYSHNIQVYKATKNADGSFTVSNDTLTLTDGVTSSKSFNSLSGDDYTTLTIGDFTDTTYLAIRGERVYIDDFSATSADIVKTRSLKINNETAVKASPDADADGKFPIVIEVELANTGDYDLAPGDDGYSITVTERNSGDSIGTAPITKALAAGATGKDTITVYGDYAKYPDNTGYKVRENITGSQYEYQVYIDPIPYLPVLTVRDDRDYAVDSGATVNYGMISNSVAKKFAIQNTGAKTLNVTSITVPDGFLVDKTAFAVAPHEKDTITVTASVANPGQHTGNLEITADEVNKFTLTLSATALDSTKYFVNFEDGKIPAGALAESNWSVVDWNINNNAYVLENSMADETKFITPLLKVAKGDVLQFDAGKRSSNSFVNVYFSPDRKNWTRVDSIGADQMSDESSYSWAGSKYTLTTFTVTDIPEGNFYVAFGSGYAHIDNIYGFEVVPVAHDLVVASQDIPATGSVNDQFIAKATLRNIAPKAEAADSYTATLHFGNETVSAEAVRLESGSDNTFTFNITPHKAGTYKAYVEFALNDGTTVTGDTVNVTIAEEVASNEVQVGANNANENNTPLNSYYNNSETVTVYDADLLADLPSGAKITSITYKGYYNGTNPKDINTTLGIWIANTTDAPVTSGSTPNVDEMTEAYAGPYTLTSVGSSTNHVPLITVTLKNPFTYTGGNLRVVTRSENQDTYSSNYYYETTNENNHTWGRQNDRASEFATASYIQRSTPVIYFGIEKDPTVVSGTVKDSLGNAIADASVRFISGNVEYSDSTDAEGKYSIQLKRDALTYTLRVDATGFAPYIAKDQKYTASATKDIVLAPATGLFVEDYSIPASGTVNSANKATITLSNDIAQTIAADAYDAQLFIDGEVVASATDKADIAVSGSATVNIDFTPHKAGKFPAYIKATYDGNEYVTAIDSITIAEETFGGDYQFGDSTTINGDGSPQTPWNNWYKQSQSVVFYTPAEIGLEKGSIITSIRYRGRLGRSGADNSGKEAASLYIGNTDATPSADNAASLLADTASLVQLLDLNKDSLEYNAVRNDSTIDIININIPGGFEYTGGNIVIVFDGNHLGQTDNRISYVVDGTKPDQAFGRATDSGNLSSSNFESQSSLPVLYVTVQNRKNVSGTVVNKKTLEPVANATVLLSSNGVEYRDTTDADGKYSIDVAKVTLTYDAIFSADGFITDTISGVSFADSSAVVVNDTIAPAPVLTNVTGTVKGISVINHRISDATAISGATVTVTDADGNAVATATTADDGTYTVSGLVEDSVYTITFSAAGYIDSTVTVTAGTEDQVVDVTLYTKEALGINGINVNNNVFDGNVARGNVYTIGGQLVGRNVDVTTLRRGVYIINGKKYTVK